MKRWMRLHVLGLLSAIRRLGRQPLATALAVLVIGIAVAIPILAAVALKSASAVASRLDAEPHVNVFLVLGAAEADVRRVEAILRESPEVAAVRFVPREKALEELRATTHLAELLATLDRNPLPHAFVVRARTRDASTLLALRDRWHAMPGVDQVVADVEWTERLARWVRFGNRILGASAAALSLAVVFIVGHLIRLQVVMRREEIEVSQLVGATAADVRRPFLYHGFFQGLLAGVVALALGASVTAWMSYELQGLVSGYATEFKVVFLDFGMTAGIALGVGALGWFGAWLSVGWELRRFSPVR